MTTTRKKYKAVAVGGTFDELHKGHRALLMKAFQVGEHIIIGMSSDTFVKKMGKPHFSAPYDQRVKELLQFLDKSSFSQRAQIVPIDDIYGSLLISNGFVEALVVSEETKPTAIEINRKRKQLGLSELQIITIEMVPSENDISISTTRIRKGEIDREGRILKRS